MIGINEYHFEWCPKYRYKCMRRENINTEVEGFIRQAAVENNIQIKTMAVGFDHVHLDANIPFTIAPSKAMGLMKGRSAYLIFRRFPNFRKRYPKGHFWSPGKFCRSMSGVDSYTVDNYIENQQFDKLQESIEQAKEEARQMGLAVFL